MTTFSAKAIQKNKKVTTVRGPQTHRGWTGIVYVRGQRKPFLTGTFHQKQKAAVATAQKMGRWLVKDPANIDTAIEQGWQAK